MYWLIHSSSAVTFLGLGYNIAYLTHSLTAARKAAVGRSALHVNRSSARAHASCHAMRVVGSSESKNFSVGVSSGVDSAAQVDELIGDLHGV